MADVLRYVRRARSRLFDALCNFTGGRGLLFYRRADGRDDLADFTDCRAYALDRGNRVGRCGLDLVNLGFWLGARKNILNQTLLSLAEASHFLGNAFA